MWFPGWDAYNSYIYVTIPHLGSEGGLQTVMQEDSFFSVLALRRTKCCIME